MYGRYSDPSFEAKYTYPGSDLGYSWTREKTAFRLWAPTARTVAVNLYRSGDPDARDLLETIPMKPDLNGTWVAERSGDLNGVYYTYTVDVENSLREVCDPYARTTGVNGHRAMVLDLSSTNPAGWDCDRNPHADKRITDTAIYELHIRDLSIDESSGILHKGKYLGLTETGTTTASGIPTGLDHIKSLGVTHVHLLPFYDYGSVDEARLDEPQFNWGYDPVNFNVPEGSYSTDPYHGEVRVRELKAMIKAMHDNGLAVVMDVVYNHVYEAGDFCVNRIVPYYFSRTDKNGKLSNGSGCGNDTASERSMVRKYIVDSIKYWTEEYHIDGFRFDLVGLIDTQTIRELMEEVHKFRPDVIFYGEGWTMKTELTKENVTLCTQHHGNQVPGFAFFNDTLRDLLRGSVFYSHEKGFVAGKEVDKASLENNFMGHPTWASTPTQTVNYVSCHDNNTLIDRLQLGSPGTAREVLIRMNHLAAAYSILSQGIPFFQAGEEMLRSKPDGKGGLEHNSFKSSDAVNSFKWNDLNREEYQTAVEFYRGLLEFRRAHPLVRMSSADEVLNHISPIHKKDPHLVAFHGRCGMEGESAEEMFAIFNAGEISKKITLPAGKWHVYIRGSKAGTKVLATIENSVSVDPVSALVIARDKAPQRPLVDVVAALLWDEKKFLICQRPEGKARELLWEFVGGKREPGETLPEALVRECREELGITVNVGNLFMEVIHAYPDIHIRLSLFHCTVGEGVPKKLEHKDIRWISPSEIPNYEFCPADADILKEIQRKYK